MRKTRQLCAIVVLTFTLALSTFAGEMHAPGVTAAGEMQTPSATAAPVMEIALGFLLNVSSLL